MKETELKVLRCNSITQLREALDYHESRGWERMGRMDVLDGVYMHIIKITTCVDDTEEITRDFTGD